MSLPRSIRWSVAAAVVVSTGLALTAFAPRSRVIVRPAPLSTEIPRIQAHFDSVLIELGAREVSALSASQQSARSALMHTLHAYRDRARFPRNYEFVAPTPYFIDPHTGVLCALAHLLESTGRRDIVDRVAASNNNVWVPQLAGDTAFASWLDSHGITLAEAARIQVPYQSAASEAKIAAYVVAVPLLALTNVTSSVWNAWGNRDGHRVSGNVLGVVTGAASLGIGGGVLAQMNNSDPRVVPGTLAVLGGITTGFAIHSIVNRHRVQTIAARDSGRSRATGSPQASIAPILPQSGRNGAGLAVAIRF